MRIVLFCILIVGLSACETLKNLPTTTATNNARTVPPKRTPVAVAAGATLLGKASFYGGKFHGRRTASGEIFDKNKLTAAHKSLPFQTQVEVTNLRNNRKVTVVINDRLPATSKREIDLSEKAAQTLDMIRDGVVDVRIVVVR